MARDPGGPCQSVAGNAPAMVAEPLPALAAQGRSEVPQGAEQKAKIWHGTENAAQRGCRKATRGAGNRPGGLTGPPWLRSRRPRNPSHLAGTTREKDCACSCSSQMSDGPAMTQPSRQLTIDEAMGEFQALIREQPGDAAPGESWPPETPEEAEARLFRMAEVLVGLACPDPRACIDQRCCRDRLCRHWGYVKMKESTGRCDHPRRTPGPKRCAMRSGCTCRQGGEASADHRLLQPALEPRGQTQLSYGNTHGTTWRPLRRYTRKSESVVRTRGLWQELGHAHKAGVREAHRHENWRQR